MADRNPVMARPNTTPTRDSTEAIITHPRLNRTPLPIYSFFRPKVSEYGANTSDPTSCPNNDTDTNKNIERV